MDVIMVGPRTLCTQHADWTMDGIMVGPWMLSTHNGLDHGCHRHDGWLHGRLRGTHIAGREGRDAMRRYMQDRGDGRVSWAVTCPIVGPPGTSTSSGCPFRPPNQALQIAPVRTSCSQHEPECHREMVSSVCGRAAPNSSREVVSQSG